MIINTKQQGSNNTRNKSLHCMETLCDVHPSNASSGSCYSQNDGLFIYWLKKRFCFSWLLKAQFCTSPNYKANMYDHCAITNEGKERN